VCAREDRQTEREREASDKDAALAERTGEVERNSG